MSTIEIFELATGINIANLKNNEEKEEATSMADFLDNLINGKRQQNN